VDSRERATRAARDETRETDLNRFSSLRRVAPFSVQRLSPRLRARDVRAIVAGDG